MIDPLRMKEAVESAAADYLASRELPGLAIALVAPGSPAEAAGLKAGQLITALDGRPASELGVAGYTALRTAKAGGVLTLTLQDGAQVPVTLKDYY